MTTVTTTDSPSQDSVDNGVNVEALLGAREALTASRRPPSSRSRATCEWENGTHSHATVEDFFGLGEEQKHGHPSTSTPTTRDVRLGGPGLARRSTSWSASPAA